MSLIWHRSHRCFRVFISLSLCKCILIKQRWKVLCCQSRVWNESCITVFLAVSRTRGAFTKVRTWDSEMRFASPRAIVLSITAFSGKLYMCEDSSCVSKPNPFTSGHDTWPCALQRCSSIIVLFIFQFVFYILYCQKRLIIVLFFIYIVFI